MEEVLKQILAELKGLKEGQERIEKKLDTVHDQTANLTEFRTEANMKLDRVAEVIEFLKHKEYQNEQDIYSIKKRIQAV